jgi:hypothetical protein
MVEPCQGPRFNPSPIKENPKCNGPAQLSEGLKLKRNSAKCWQGCGGTGPLTWLWEVKQSSRLEGLSKRSL